MLAFGECSPVSTNSRDSWEALREALLVAMAMLGFSRPAAREWVCSQFPGALAGAAVTSFRNVLDRTPAQKHFINWWNLLLTVSMPCGVSQAPLLPSKPLPVIVVSPLVVHTLWFAFKGVFSSPLDSLLALRVCLSAGLLRSLWAVTLNMKTVWLHIYPVQNSCSLLPVFLSPVVSTTRWPMCGFLWVSTVRVLLDFLNL